MQLKFGLLTHAKKFLTITELTDTYVPSTVIWRYTRECCIFKLLNKAPRVRNINILFAFRCLIADILNQLKGTQKKSLNRKFQMYCGQAKGKDELKTLLASIREFISMNSFLSTSKNRDVAISFAKSGEESPAILFEIDIDTCQLTKPFADITNMSYFQTKEEVLFMLISYFE
ncbi:unnamed protein product [Didymodactylos carnosus]|uniref:NAD(P)(+)--arginine ADP-ribosyltransferase n=1 Tax=Didymodactylos carnosus TaxID=1234261 RepID=A0A814CIK8_9BILA|nr:unnamed protein product [Didymodactylos carnosus]CAF3719281.1 unnamed protein product [Didymodactylos carnosus]